MNDPASSDRVVYKILTMFKGSAFVFILPAKKDTPHAPGSAVRKETRIQGGQNFECYPGVFGHG